MTEASGLEDRGPRTAVYPPRPVGMSDIVQIYVFVLAAFVGYQVISRVPPLLHTPLMSGSNAISGITIIGAMVAAGHGEGGLATGLGLAAVALATINVVGGFLVTDRMLEMFRKDQR